MERSAYLATAWRLGRYYRTYPAYVEDEVRAALGDPDAQFERGPVTLSARGTAADDRPAFVVHDRNYVSSRWPGDAYLFGRTFRDLLESQRSLSRTDRSIRPDHRHLAPAAFPPLRHPLLARYSPRPASPPWKCIAASPAAYGAL